jgi:hypothetical protein
MAMPNTGDAIEIKTRIIGFGLEPKTLLPRTIEKIKNTVMINPSAISKAVIMVFLLVNRKKYTKVSLFSLLSES